jgi:hypothetical protein
MPGAVPNDASSDSPRRTKAPEPELRYEHFRLVYPSGTAVMAFYADGATLEKVRDAHSLAVVHAVEESL